ncbi:polysaccharide lyase 8 family protein [Paenibacillus swuensis]|uniref:polysaccharide lyase 8 family protein n=1 Tax=Paenibacillus swuensis TaxID=1178515 RepID=UPI000837C929|nr:polysaccharide lyase 8 family protein [Paenibacillus swuensis]
MTLYTRKIEAKVKMLTALMVSTIMVGVVPLNGLVLATGSESVPSALTSTTDATATATAITEETWDSLRGKWKEMLTGGEAYDPAHPDIAERIRSITELAQSFRSSMAQGDARTVLWSDIPGTSNSDHITTNYSRLRSMALAYATKGSALYEDPTTKSEILAALEWLYKHRYNENSTKFGNWYPWDIGIPVALNDILVLMYDELDEASIHKYLAPIDKFTPTADGTSLEYWGANKTWRCTAIALRGILGKNEAKVAQARDQISPVFDYVTHLDGFYEDGSFIQHEKYAYTGGYGVSLLRDVGNFVYLLSDSPWQVTDPKAANMFRWVHDSFMPLMYKGAMMDMVRGREISRDYNQDHESGHSVIRAVLRLSQIAPQDEAAAFRSMAKYWIEQDTYKKFNSSSSVEMIVLADRILKDSAILPMKEPVGTKVFSAMDRVTHYRPGYALGISMFSNRIGTHETINIENLKGWYTAHGMSYLYNNDLSQFSDGFWPTVNPYRLPGTTVDTVKRADALGNGFLSPKSHVGGVQINKEYSAVAMDLQDFGNLLSDRIYSLGENTGEVTAEFDVTPLFDRNDPQNNAIVGYVDSSNPVAELAKSNMLIRMSQQGTFDVRNGANYEATVKIPYEKGKTYHVRMVSNTQTQKYDVWITDESGAETKITNNYSYRTGASEINDIGKMFVWRSNIQKVDIKLENHYVNGVATSLTPVMEPVMTAKKAWFLLDNEIVALGAGISAPEGRTVETIVENRKLNTAGDNVLTVDGVRKESGLGAKEELNNVKWAHLQGSVPGADIGYYFPQAATLHTLRESRTGSWSDIDGRILGRTPFTRNYMTLWFNHGVQPEQAAYAYVLLPNMTSEQVKAYSAKPEITVLENSSELQAVKDTKQGLLGVHFWKEGSRAVEGVKSLTPSSVMLKETGKETEIALSDPTQKQEQLVIEYTTKNAKLIEAGAGVQVKVMKDSVQITVDVKNAQGKSFTVKLKTHK